MREWYELRVAGSAGTAEGMVTGAIVGIAVGEGGRVCSLTSGNARRFESLEQATEYLGRIKVSGDYQFEPVLCRDSVEAALVAPGLPLHPA
jgi:hypothetical protein